MVPCILVAWQHLNKLASPLFLHPGLFTIYLLVHDGVCPQAACAGPQGDDMASAVLLSFLLGSPGESQLSSQPTSAWFVTSARRSELQSCMTGAEEISRALQDHDNDEQDKNFPRLQEMWRLGCRGSTTNKPHAMHGRRCTIPDRRQPRCGDMGLNALTL